MPILPLLLVTGKRGLCFYPGRLYAGKIVIADIGIYEQEAVKASARCLEKEDLKLFPERDPGGNKGTFGKILFVTGSAGMCGAAYLSASAALPDRSRNGKDPDCGREQDSFADPSSGSNGMQQV